MECLLLRDYVPTSLRLLSLPEALGSGCTEAGAGMKPHGPVNVKYRRILGCWQVPERILPYPRQH